MRRIAAAGWQASAVEGMLEALRPTPDGECAEIAGLPPAKGTDDQHAAVLAFIEGVKAFSMLRGWPPLADLATRADPAFRHRALRAAAASKDEAALRVVALSDRRSSPDAPWEDRVYGSLAPSAAADVIGDSRLLERADPEILC